MGYTEIKAGRQHGSAENFGMQELPFPHFDIKGIEQHSQHNSEINAGASRANRHRLSEKGKGSLANLVADAREEELREMNGQSFLSKPEIPELAYGTVGLSLSSSGAPATGSVHSLPAR